MSFLSWPSFRRQKIKSKSPINQPCHSRRQMNEGGGSEEEKTNAPFIPYPLRAIENVVNLMNQILQTFKRERKKVVTAWGETVKNRMRRRISDAVLVRYSGRNLWKMHCISYDKRCRTMCLAPVLHAVTHVCPSSLLHGRLMTTPCIGRTCGVRCIGNILQKCIPLTPNENRK